MSRPGSTLSLSGSCLRWKQVRPWDAESGGTDTSVDKTGRGAGAGESGPRLFLRLYICAHSECVLEFECVS